jgi:hypothetical protein
MAAAYDLPEAVIRGLTAMALAAHPVSGRFLALAVGPRDLMADVARTVERKVVERSAAAGHDAYESSSLFFLVIDRQTGMPAGAGRVIEGGGRTLDDAPDRIGAELSIVVEAHGLHDGRIWDVATFGMLPSYRGTKAGLAVRSLLYRTFINAGRRAGVRHVVAMLDHRAQRNLALLGVRFVPMAGSGEFEYHGSGTTKAMYVPFAELEPAIAEQGERLGRFRSSYAGEIRARGLRRLFTRRAAARVAAQVSTGEGLDEHIKLPGLERRRLLSRR